MKALVKIAAVAVCLFSLSMWLMVLTAFSIALVNGDLLKGWA